mgnify:CR=1 FL=1
MGESGEGGRCDCRRDDARVSWTDHWQSVGPTMSFVSGVRGESVERIKEARGQSGRQYSIDGRISRVSREVQALRGKVPP